MKDAMYLILLFLLILGRKPNFIYSKQRVTSLKNRLILKPSNNDINVFASKNYMSTFGKNSSSYRNNRNHYTFRFHYSFLYPQKKKKQYEVKNLENIPVYVVTNEFDQMIISFNFEDKPEQEQDQEQTQDQIQEQEDIQYNKQYNKQNETKTQNHSNDIYVEKKYSEKEENDWPELKINNLLLFPQIIKNNREKKREEIDLRKIQNNNSVAIFFFDRKTAEAYKEDILHLFNKNLKEKRKKLFFGSKVKFTTLQKFLEIKKKQKNKIDFVLIPSYKELQNVLKYKNSFYGTPIYYINKIKLQKSFIKKLYYDIFDKNDKQNQLLQTKVKIGPDVFLTCTVMEQDEQKNHKKINDENCNSLVAADIKGKKSNRNRYLIIQIETGNKTYIPIFFSYEQANHFYNIFWEHFNKHFKEYCFPKPYIVLDSFENILTLVKLANEKTNAFPFFDIFFVPHEEYNNDDIHKKINTTNELKEKRNFWNLYVNRFLQKLNYDFFRAFRKNLNFFLTNNDHH